MNHKNPIGEETLVIIHHDSKKGKQPCTILMNLWKQRRSKI